MKYVHYKFNEMEINMIISNHNCSRTAAIDYLTKQYKLASDIKTGKIEYSKRDKKGFIDTWNQGHIRRGRHGLVKR